MTLREWLKQQRKKKRTQDDLARALGVTQGRVSQIVNNGTRDIEMALAIEKATDRAVTVRDLIMPRDKAKKRAAA